MRISQWKKAVQILKDSPNIPLSEFATQLELDSIEAQHLIADVIEVWKFERKGGRPETYAKNRNIEIDNPRIGKWRS